jgi:hypothetical protein
MRDHLKAWRAVNQTGSTDPPWSDGRAFHRWTIFSTHWARAKRLSSDRAGPARSHGIGSLALRSPIEQGRAGCIIFRLYPAARGEGALPGKRLTASDGPAAQPVPVRDIPSRPGCGLGGSFFIVAALLAWEWNAAQY